MIHRGITLLLILLFILPALGQRYAESDDFSYALKLYNEGFFDIAAQQFNLFLSRYPASERAADAKYYQALSLLQLKDFSNARVEFQSLAVSYPDHRLAPEAWEKVGQCYLALEKPEEAARAFETVKVLYPNDARAPAALFEAAKIQFRLNRLNKCELTLRDLMDRYPQSTVFPRASLLFARLMLEKQNYDIAQKEFNRVIELKTDETTQAAAHLGMAEFYWRLGLSNKSRLQCERVLKDFFGTPAAFKSLLKLAELLARAGYLDDAIRQLNSYRPRFKSSRQKAEISLYLAAIYYLQDNTVSAREAIAAMPEFIGNDSLKAQRLFYLGHIYLKENKLDKSLETFSTLSNDSSLRKLSPAFAAQADKQTGLIYLKMGEFDRGYEILTGYLESNPKASERDDLWAVLVRHALAAGKFGKAEWAFERLLRDAPNSAIRDDLLFEFGKAHFKAEEYAAAVKYFGRVMNEYFCSEKRDSAEVYLNVIQNYYRVRESISVNKLAGLVGRMLAGEERQQLKTDLARIYLYQLINIPEAIQLLKSVSEQDSDSARLGEAAYLLGIAYQRSAELKIFHGQNADQDWENCRNAFKHAMHYLPSVSFKDSLSFAFLQTNIGANSQSRIEPQKQITYWKHFVDSYPGSALTDEARFILAGLNRQTGDTATARLLLEQLAAQANSPWRGNALWELSRMAEESSAYHDAIGYLKTFLLDIPNHPRQAEGFARLAMLEEKVGEYEAATQLLERLFNTYDYTDVGQKALHKMPAAYIDAGKFSKAVGITAPFVAGKSEKDLLLASLNSPEIPEFYFYHGKALYLSGDLTGARTRLFEYLQGQPDAGLRDEALILLAEIARAQKDEDAALIHLKLVAQNQNSPFFIQATHKMADIYFDRDNYQDALPLYAKVIAGSSDSEQILQATRRELICLIQQGKLKLFKQKLTLFKKNYKKHPLLKNNLAQFEFETGKYYYSRKNFDSAIKRFETVQKKYKKTEFVDDATYYLGLTYSTLNRVEKAQDILTGFIERFPDSPMISNIYITLGTLYYRGDKKDLSLEAFKKAVELARDRDTRKVSLSNLIKMYRDLGLWDGVLTKTREYVEEFPKAEDHIDKKILIGSALIRLNRFSEAVEYLKSVKFEATSEQEPEIQFYIGEAYFNAGQYENAIREFVKIPLLSKKTQLQWEASALYFSGQSYEKLGRKEDALRMYQQIIDRPGILIDLKREARKKIDQLRKTG